MASKSSAAASAASPAASADETPSVRVKAKVAINHDGKRYEAGAPLPPLTEKQAAALVDVKAAEIISDIEE